MPVDVPWFCMTDGITVQHEQPVKYWGVPSERIGTAINDAGRKEIYRPRRRRGPEMLNIKEIKRTEVSKAKEHLWRVFYIRLSDEGSQRGEFYFVRERMGKVACGTCDWGKSNEALKEPVQKRKPGCGSVDG